VAIMVATLEQLIFDAETAGLEAVWERVAVSGTVQAEELHEILEHYMVRWLVGGDQHADWEADPETWQEYLPHWQEISAFLQGQVESFGFDRLRYLSGHRAALGAPAWRVGSSAAAFTARYSFDDAHAVVGTITKSFGPYWETVCQSMKDSLVAMDKTHTGRVRLGDFYGSGLDAEWRFGESESYLRQLGALDESSSWHGKRVIIPNYLQATSNCIVTSDHYKVCCANECEGIMGDIEAAVQYPVAAPEEIIGVIANMSSSSDPDEPLQLGRAMRAQLKQIAGRTGGKVPLHGRLFAQWLHYVFPRECPFPHKAGSFVQLPPQEFGEDYIATREEMAKHAHGVENATANWEAREMPPPEDDHHMSQWSHEEEFVGDYSAHMTAPWETRRGLAGAVGVAICAAVLWVGLSAGPAKSGLASGDARKLHLV